MGAEPTWNGIATDVQISQALSWYNFFYDQEDAKAFTISALKAMGSYHSSIEKIPEYRFLVVGWISKMLDMGLGFPSDLIQRHKERIDGLVAEAKALKEEAEAKATPVVHVDNERHEWFNILETGLEGILFGTPFNFDSVNSKYLDETRRRIQLYMTDMQLLLDGNPDAQEYYKHMKKKKEIRDALERYTALYDGLESKKVVKVRAVRPPKPVTPQKLVKKLKFMPKDDKYGVSSVAPTSIIGCTELWTFHVASRYLTVYRAEEGKTLSVERSKIVNLDTKTSFCKKLRKPEVTLPMITTGGKASVKKVMDGLTSKAQEMSPRINQETILLRTFK